VKFVECAGENVSTLCAGLREAFDYFGGVPEHVLFDNTKAVVIECDAYGEGLHRWNSELRDLAEGCGFTPRLCRLADNATESLTRNPILGPATSKLTKAE
jgi:transposase